MKIVPGTQNYIAAADATRKKSAGRQPEEAQQPAGKPGDAFSVQLSATVERMKTPPVENDNVRLDKVEAIRKQLAAGTYNLSGKDVADKILNVLKG